MARILVTREIPGTAVERLRARHAVDVWDGALPPEPAVLRERAAGCQALLTMISDRIDDELLDAAPDLEVVANYAVGSDNFDLAACRARGVATGNTPDALTNATADLAFALILAAARNVIAGHEAVRAGEWKTWEPAGWLGHDVHGATLALIGPGRIGEAVARRASGFDMEILRVGRHDDLHAALARADVISLHCPLTEQTERLIDASALAVCKPTAILVNTARGKIVDQEALRAALTEGRLAAAGLDVTDPEPLPPEHPLFTAPNLLVLPHVGSATHTARARMADIAVANIEAGLAGEPLPHPVA